MKSPTTAGLPSFCPLFAANIALSAILSVSAPAALASLKLESSVVVVEQGDGEGVISMKNQDSAPILLYTEIVNVPEDPDDLLLASPPIARVEANESQAVRLILRDGVALATERYKRVTFEGIPQTAPNKLQLTVRQNIPVIIRPANLMPNSEPWKLLKWRAVADGISVENTGPYVIRMSTELKAQPAGHLLTLPKNYILPGETLVLNGSATMTGVEAISFRPASMAGYLLEARQARLATPEAAAASASPTPAP